MGFSKIFVGDNTRTVVCGGCLGGAKNTNTD
jgi:hypothetical protein